MGVGSKHHSWDQSITRDIKVSRVRSQYHECIVAALQQHIWIVNISQGIVSSSILFDVSSFKVIYLLKVFLVFWFHERFTDVLLIPSYSWAFIQEKLSSSVQQSWGTWTVARPPGLWSFDLTLNQWYQCSANGWPFFEPQCLSHAYIRKTISSPAFHLHLWFPDMPQGLCINMRSGGEHYCDNLIRKTWKRMQYEALRP